MTFKKDDMVKLKSLDELDATLDDDGVLFSNKLGMGLGIRYYLQYRKLWFKVICEQNEYYTKVVSLNAPKEITEILPTAFLKFTFASVKDRFCIDTCPMGKRVSERYLNENNSGIDAAYDMLLYVDECKQHCDYNVIRKQVAEEIITDIYKMQEACYKDEVIITKLEEKYNVKVDDNEMSE